jgi:hypothetical protein
MKFTVTWRKEVEDDLARIWLTAMDQQAFADATNAIDQQLKRDPYRNANKSAATRGRSSLGRCVYNTVFVGMIARLMYCKSICLICLDSFVLNARSPTLPPA